MSQGGDVLGVGGAAGRPGVKEQGRGKIQGHGSIRRRQESLEFGTEKDSGDL